MNLQIIDNNRKLKFFDEKTALKNVCELMKRNLQSQSLINGVSKYDTLSTDQKKEVILRLGKEVLEFSQFYTMQDLQKIIDLGFKKRFETSPSLNPANLSTWLKEYRSLPEVIQEKKKRLEEEQQQEERLKQLKEKQFQDKTIEKNYKYFLDQVSIYREKVLNLEVNPSDKFVKYPKFNAVALYGVLEEEIKKELKRFDKLKQGFYMNNRDKLLNYYNSKLPSSSPPFTKESPFVVQGAILKTKEALILLYFIECIK